MPNLVIRDIDASLFRRLDKWAQARRLPLEELAHQVLDAAERAHSKYDPNQDWTVRTIRRSRDGGCGLCDELEPLFEQPQRASS